MSATRWGYRFGRFWIERLIKKEYGMKGSRKALLLGFMMAAGAVAAPTIASAGVILDINVAPPPVQVETVPPPPAVGMIWAPGFWEWRGNQHVWVGGHYMHGRPGYHWVGDRWSQHGANWHHEVGHWAR
jgi:hypothetical protein